ncbi:MAG TPA: hypothetical protein DEP35_10500 [Deltaproteobacteria bacterium]|jgi:hypothetical protein|nr:hypothetical protein [Deltaproteobacteria bacterium]
MSTPRDFERAPAPAAWTPAQVAAVREASAELRAARLRAGKPPVRRIQRFAHPLVGYAALLAGLLLFGPILTCAGVALPVLTCAGISATHAGHREPMASPQPPEPSTAGATREAEGAASWYSYRGRDGVTVYGFGVPPLGSTVIDLDEGDHRPSLASPGAGSGTDTPVAALRGGRAQRRHH